MSLSFKFDHSKPGLRKVFKEYQELALRHVWEVGEEGVGSRKILETVTERLTEKKKISRASIIMFLEKLRTQGVLGCKDATGKGGHRRIYFPLMHEKEFVKLLFKTLVKSMLTDFPEESLEVLNEL
jgi:predicted transcriptional regulator